jgi:hypothetical protein
MGHPMREGFEAVTKLIDGRALYKGIAKFTLDNDRKSTTIGLWIVWVQHLLLYLIQPVGR